MSSRDGHALAPGTAARSSARSRSARRSLRPSSLGLRGLDVDRRLVGLRLVGLRLVVLRRSSFGGFGSSASWPCRAWASGRCFLGRRRSNFGRGALRSGSISKMWAIFGMRVASRAMVAFTSAWRSLGSDVGMTLSRTGANASASSTATHRSAGASSVRAAPAPSVSLVASSGGSGDAGLGRAGAQAQGPHDAADLDGGGQLGEPRLVLGVGPGGQPLAQRLGEGPGLVVLGGRVGGGDHRAQVAQVEHLEVALGGLGAVAPLGGAHLRHQLLRQLEQGPGGDRRRRRRRCARRSASRSPDARPGARRARPAPRPAAAPPGATRAARCDGSSRAGGAWPWAARPRGSAAARGGCGAAGDPCARAGRRARRPCAPRHAPSPRPRRPGAARRGEVRRGAARRGGRPRAGGPDRRGCGSARVVVTSGSSVGRPAARGAPAPGECPSTGRRR